MRAIRVLWERAASLPLSGRRVCVMAYQFVDLSEANDCRERERLLGQLKRLINTAETRPSAVGSKWRDV